MTPDTIGRYKVTRELGRGAMGVVYEADDPNIGRTVALKTIYANTIGTNPEEVSARFKNEARAAGGLSHPNIVTVFDAGEHDGTLYLAMEFLQGETLEQHLAQRRTISADRAIAITRQICAALDYAHGKGIVHRDIKPANVMLGPSDSVKITDFGIARTAEAITMTGQVMGTPHYMSPEQVRGRPVDGRSDLFSVAVMLYEMVTGERPFDGQSITTIMYKIVHENPTPPRALDSSISPGLSAVVEKALSKSPEDRYQTGASLVTALDNNKSFNTTIRDFSTAETVNFRPGTQIAPPETQELPPATTEEPPARGRGGRRRGGRERWVPALIVVMAAAAILYTRWHKSERPQQPVSPQQTTSQQASPQQQPTTAPSAPIPPAAPGSEKTSTAATTAGSLVQTKPGNAGSAVATMKVTSNPPTATIFVDNKSTGLNTPAQVQISRGEHSVSVRMPGFQPSTAKFNVKGGEELEFSPALSVAVPGMPDLHIPKVDIPNVDVEKLKSLDQVQSSEFWKQWVKAEEQAGGKAVAGAPQILVNSKPTGAHIFLNGNNTGKTSPAILSNSPGTYHVRLEMDGFAPAEQDVTVAVGHPGRVNIRLKPVHSGNQEP